MFFGENFPRKVVGGGKGGGGGFDSDTWTSCKATSCLGQLFRLLVSPLNVLPMMLAWCLQWSSENLPHQSCQNECARKIRQRKVPKCVVAGTQYRQFLAQIDPASVRSRASLAGEPSGGRYMMAALGGQFADKKVPEPTFGPNYYLDSQAFCCP